MIEPIPWLSDTGVNCSVLRLDKITPNGIGNKAFKLKHNLSQAKAHNCHTLLSFGGPWSNHLHALARMGGQHHFKTIGIVRGYAEQPLTPMLEDAINDGMQLYFVGKQDYRRLRENPLSDILPITTTDGVWIIPEGASNSEGVSGCEEIISLLKGQPWDGIFVACGTGATLQGLLTGAEKAEIKSLFYGVTVLNNYQQITKQITEGQQNSQYKKNWQLIDGCQWGNYAKLPPHLHQFMREFEAVTGILLDPVYTVKMMYGMREMVNNGIFGLGQNLLAIHTGGLQGRRGFCI